MSVVHLCTKHIASVSERVIESKSREANKAYRKFVTVGYVGVN
jgi:hypothetical protein